MYKKISQIVLGSLVTFSVQAATQNVLADNMGKRLEAMSAFIKATGDVESSFKLMNNLGKEQPHTSGPDLSEFINGTPDSGGGIICVENSNHVVRTSNDPSELMQKTHEETLFQTILNELKVDPNKDDKVVVSFKTKAQDHGTGKEKEVEYMAVAWGSKAILGEKTDKKFVCYIKAPKPAA